MTDYVLSGLTKRRAELAGEAEALRVRLAAIGADIGHLDAVIRQFDPDYDLASIRPKRPRAQDGARPGEMSRFILGVLREVAAPITTAAIVQRLIAERGMDGEDRRLVQKVTKRVGMALARQRETGVVRSVREVGEAVVWAAAR